jgi:hypothetical protein
MRTMHSVDVDWWGMPEYRRAAILAWLTRNGIDIHRVEAVRLAGEGRLAIKTCQCGPDRHVLVDDEHIVGWDVREVAEPPPSEWFDDGIGG